MPPTLVESTRGTWNCEVCRGAKEELGACEEEMPRSQKIERRSSKHRGNAIGASRTRKRSGNAIGASRKRKPSGNAMGAREQSMGARK